ncbi:ABC transporter ATP-binding protein [uncultured Castellaniella sp.]|uniref:ABC transporter ATP-binding protein n=1 Tax=uncultured Castellaniella sp. TaxID=647907 RepID=UPI00262113E7|nr:ABC transporter ATP-binding protein [uncultured Castellaniella sp.]
MDTDAGNPMILSRIRKYFGATEVLSGIDLTIPQGSVLALLGPSGCGKTTLLRLIAGFDPPDEGRIAFGGRVMASPTVFVPPERRGIGYVPQEGTLFPHLTVEGNIRFGLPRQAGRRERVEEVLALTGLSGLGRRYPHELSGGQQQRVALARALAPGPSLVLLDEPFNALDLDLRRSMCEEVARVLRQTGTTTVLVTHDPGEAFAVSDQLAVMQSGRIMQCARPEQVYWQPASAAVARLTGPAIFLPGRSRADGTASCALGELPRHPDSPCPEGPASVLVRPEQVQWTSDGPGVPARVDYRSFRGDHTLIGVDLGNLCLDLRVPSLSAPQLGAEGRLRVLGACMAYPEP